jgi:hypothetical protein
MNDYVMNKKPEPASNEIVWAFDLGKGSIGEAVRRGNEFLHKASLLIPAEFAETKTAAGRRRMWRTRQAHGSSGFACSSSPLARRRSSARSRNATRPFGRAASSRRQ